MPRRQSRTRCSGKKKNSCRRSKKSCSWKKNQGCRRKSGTKYSRRRSTTRRSPSPYRASNYVSDCNPYGRDACTTQPGCVWRRKSPFRKGSCANRPRSGPYAWVPPAQVAATVQAAAAAAGVAPAVAAQVAQVAAQASTDAPAQSRVEYQGYLQRQVDSGDITRTQMQALLAAFDDVAPGAIGGNIVMPGNYNAANINPAAVGYDINQDPNLVGYPQQPGFLSNLGSSLYNGAAAVGSAIGSASAYAGRGLAP